MKFSLSLLYFMAAMIVSSDSGLIGGITNVTPGTIGELIKKIFTGNLPDLIERSYKCMEQQIKGLNPCNISTSIDPFYLAKVCYGNTFVENFAEIIKPFLPKSYLLFGVPVYYAQSRCYDEKAATSDMIQIFKQFLASTGLTNLDALKNQITTFIN